MLPIIRRAVELRLLVVVEKAGLAAIKGEVKAAAERVVIDACD